MGLNLVTICQVHRQYNYSMRGEEFLDFQVIMRSKHSNCMQRGLVIVVPDNYTSVQNEDSGYTEMWDYDDRPKVEGIEHTLNKIGRG